MTAPTGTYLSSAAVGNREDLTNVIYRISPTATPFLSMASKGKATNTLHEWQTQDLASAAVNKQLEGDDATNKTVTASVRLKCNAQISTKTVQVSGTQRAMNPAGRDDELGYQMSLASLEIKRDMEYGIFQGIASAATAGTSPRQVNTMGVWVNDNTSNNGGAWAAGVYTAAAGTNNTDSATTRAFTEAQLKSVLQLCFTAGGEPDNIFLAPASKQTFSSFTGNATRMDKSEDKTLYASVEVYMSDFGELRAIPSRWQRTRDVFVLQADKWAVAYLRPFTTVDLAKTGDADRKEIIVEYAVEARAPKANGAVYDIA
jgi:Family of unknown function (DUF5309)